MYNIFGFYKFKKIINLKKKKELLDNYLKQENFRGTIILSPEGVNGTISFKIDRYITIKRNIKIILKIKVLSIIWAITMVLLILKDL